MLLYSVLQLVLVTGGAGYIGSVVTEALVNRGREPVVLDNLPQGHRAAVIPGVTLVDADLQDHLALERLFTQQQIEAVIHLAPLAVVSDSVAPSSQIAYEVMFWGGPLG